ncbi:NADP-dependent oxidoreductase [Brevibacterium sp. BRM-1]|uniref:NADP-dependent oxidoreductase n=1 Tax=Brevibacterium sp. BRM-1 TaxID=2999062 RepID=UPI00227E22CE|nr:NADP-dependent oxidoreductase [Brevibacterium sp. BRM-1]WAL39845.1 NADP-dependent oxidoreductase [Brevibacterium sp. BRM-1]
MTMNQRYLLAKRPEGAPTPDDFALDEAPVPTPGEGEALLRTLYLSLDPYMRGRMSDAKSYAKPVELGQVMVGATVAEVVETNSDAVAQGDIVLAYGGWQTYSVQAADQLRVLDPDYLPVTTALGVLGMPGFTAYSGLLRIGDPQPGETVAVAAATGPVGSAVGQIAKIKGARTIGIAGGERKVAQLREFGFDAALDHRGDDLRGALKAAAPDGIDVYFENVGGPVWEAVKPRLNTYARVPVCGLVATYNGAADPSPAGSAERLMGLILTKSLTIRGFIQTEFVASMERQFLTEMGQWVHDGKVTYLEDITDGFERTPETFIGMLEGRNFGKTIVRVAD